MEAAEGSERARLWPTATLCARGANPMSLNISRGSPVSTRTHLSSRALPQNVSAFGPTIGVLLWATVLRSTLPGSALSAMLKLGALRGA